MRTFYGLHPSAAKIYQALIFDILTVPFCKFEKKLGDTTQPKYFLGFDYYEYGLYFILLYLHVMYNIALL